MHCGKWVRVSFMLMLALGLATVAFAQLRDPRLSDSQEPGSVIVFHKFIKGMVPLNGDSAPRTEIAGRQKCLRAIAPDKTGHH